MNEEDVLMGFKKEGKSCSSFELKQKLKQSQSGRISLRTGNVLRKLCRIVLNGKNISNILLSNRDYICQHLLPELHFDYLCQANILSQTDCEVIENEPSNEKKASKFLDIIISKGPNSFDHLCAALYEEKTQLFLFERLNEKYEIKKQFFLDLCAAKDGKPRRVPTSLPIASIDLEPSSCVEPQQSANS